MRIGPELALGGNPRLLGASVYVLSVLFLGAACWAYLTHVEVVVLARGVVRPEGDTIRITSEAGGKIEAVQVREGDYVLEGDVLVRLETSTLESERDSLLVQIMLLEERLNNVNRAIRDAARIHLLDAEELDRKTANAQFELERQAREHSLQVRTATLELEAARREYSRTQQLFEEGLVSQRDRDRVETDLDMAQTRRDETAYGAPSEDNLDSLFAAKALADAQFQSQQRDLRAEAMPLQSELSRLQSQLKKTARERSLRTIRSPVTGQLTLLQPLHSGEHIGAGNLIGAVAAVPLQTIVEAFVDNSESGSVKRGQRAWLRIEDSETVPGTVLSVSPDARFNDSSLGLYQVIISPQLLNLRLGQAMEVRVVTREERLLTLIFNRIERAFSE